MPASLPSRAAGDLGAALSNIRTPATNELSAVNYERVKDWIIAIATELGLTDGSTSGSVWEALSSVSGAWDAYEVRGDDPSPTDLAARSAVIVCDNGDGDAEVNLPPAASAEGVVYLFRKTGGTDGAYITATGDGSDEIEGDSGAFALPYSNANAIGLEAPAMSWILFCDGVSWRLGPCFGLDGDRRSVGFVYTTATPSLPYEALVLVSTASNAVAFALPSPATPAYHGKRIRIVKTNTGTSKVSLTRYASETINGAGANFDLPGSTSAARGAWEVMSDGTNWHVVTLSESASAALSSTAASDLGRTASAGVASTAARGDHVHDRGVIVGGSTITSTPTALPDQDYVAVDTTSAAIVLQLPAGSSYRRWEIAKINAGANKITLDPAGSETIQGGSSGANFDLPDSTSTTFPSWTLIRDASGNFRVL